MSRIYTVVLRATVTAAGGDTDLCELTPADDIPIAIRGIVCSQISEVGDSAAEGLAISVIRLPATVTSGNGSATTPQPLDPGDAAASFTAETNGTTVATTSGTAANLDERGWVIQNSPYEWWYPDTEFCPKARQGSVLVVRQQTTLADDATFSFTIFVEEL